MDHKVLKIISFEGTREDSSKVSGKSILDGIASNNVEMIQSPADTFRRYFNGSDEEYLEFLKAHDLILGMSSNEAFNKPKSKTFLKEHLGEYVKKFYLATRSTKTPELTKHFSQKLNDLPLNRSGSNIYERISLKIDSLTDQEFEIVAKEFRSSFNAPAFIAFIDDDVRNKQIDILLPNKVLFEDLTAGEPRKVYTTYQGQSADSIRKGLSFGKNTKDLTKTNMNLTVLLQNLYKVFDQYMPEYEFAAMKGNEVLGKSYFMHQEPSESEIETLELSGKAAQLHTKNMNDTRSSLPSDSTKEYVETKNPTYAAPVEDAKATEEAVEVIVPDTSTEEAEIIEVEVIKTASESIIEDKKSESLNTIAAYQQKLMGTQQQMALEAFALFKMDLLKGGGLIDNYEKANAQLLKTNPFALKSFDALVKVELLNIPIKDQVISEHKELIKIARAKLIVTKKEVEDLESDKADLVIEHKSVLELLKTDKLKIENEYSTYLDKTVKEIENLALVISSSEEMITLQKETIGNKDKELLSLPLLKETIENKTIMINDLHDSFKIKEELIKGLKEKGATQNQAIEEAKKTIVDKEIKLTEASKTLEIQNTKIQDLNVSIEKQDTTINGLNESLSSKTEEIKQLKSREELHNASLKELTTELETMKKLNVTLKAQNEEYAKKLEITKNMREVAGDINNETTKKGELKDAVVSNIDMMKYSAPLDNKKLEQSLALTKEPNTPEFVRLTLIKRESIDFSLVRGTSEEWKENIIFNELESLAAAGLATKVGENYTVNSAAKVLLLDNFFKTGDEIKAEWDKFSSTDSSKTKVHVETTPGEVKTTTEFKRKPRNNNK